MTTTQIQSAAIILCALASLLNGITLLVMIRLLKRFK